MAMIMIVLIGRYSVHSSGLVILARNTLISSCPLSIVGRVLYNTVIIRFTGSIASGETVCARFISDDPVIRMMHLAHIWDPVNRKSDDDCTEFT